MLPRIDDATARPSRHSLPIMGMHSRRRRGHCIDSSYTDVTGVSSDRLTLFVFKPWAGFVFTRSSTSADFSNPNAPNAPPELLGWQHKPLADCATLLATVASASGGCGNEDIAFQVRR